ncbi:MAG: MerC domain-containing protein [Verrucomicrobia bacterium]|nr:MerC domain-containing protein [Verrucomicrobiota bacterium]
MKTKTDFELERQPQTADGPLQESPKARAAGKWLGGIASILSSATAIACPLCIPALGALLSTVGLGFALNAKVLHSLLVVLLAVNVGMLAWAAKLHGRWWVLAVGTIGAAALYVGRYVWLEPPLTWAGAAMLVGTSVASLVMKHRGCRCGSA